MVLHDEPRSGTSTGHVLLEGKVPAMTGCWVHIPPVLGPFASCLTVHYACKEPTRIVFRVP